MSEISPGLPQFFSYVKQVSPDATDADIKEAYDAANIADGTRESLAAGIKMVRDKAIARSSQLNTQLKSPYAGTTQEAANPLNPAAASISQFDPALMTAARAKQQAEYDRTFPSRTIGSIFAGMSGSANVQNRHKDAWDKIDKQNMLASIEGQQKMQDQATAGLTAAGKQQDQNIASGKYTTDQLKAEQDIAQSRQKTELGQFGVDAQKRLNDPNSTETTLAKQLLSDQLRTSGNASPAISKMIQSGNVTAQQIMAFLEPKALEAFKTKTGITSVQAGTAKTTEETKTITAERPGKSAESDVSVAKRNTIVQPNVQKERDREALDTIRREYEANQGTPGEEVNQQSRFREMTRLIKSINDAPKDPGDNSKSTLKVPEGSNMSISSGGVTIAPSPAITGAQSAAAKEDETNRAQSAVSNKFGIEGLTSSLAKRSATAFANGLATTGKIADWMTRNMSGTEAERMKSDIANLVDAKIAYGGATGSNPIKDRDEEIKRIMQMTNKAFQNEVLNFNQQVIRQEQRQKAFSDHIAKKGTATGFDDSKIKNATYMFNPATGESALVGPKSTEAARKQGFKPLPEINR